MGVSPKPSMDRIARILKPRLLSFTKRGDRFLSWKASTCGSVHFGAHLGNTSYILLGDGRLNISFYIYIGIYNIFISYVTYLNILIYLDIS